MKSVKVLTSILTIGYILSLTLSTFAANTSTKLVKIRNCNSLSSEVLPKKQILETNLGNTKLISSNILASLDTKLKKSTATPEKINLISKNIEKFSNDLDYFLIERENLIFKLDELSKIDCQSSKPQYLTKIKSFNQLYKNNIKRNNDLKRYLKLNILSDLENLEKGSK